MNNTFSLSPSTILTINNAIQSINERRVPELLRKNRETIYPLMLNFTERLNFSGVFDKIKKSNEKGLIALSNVTKTLKDYGFPYGGIKDIGLSPSQYYLPKPETHEEQIRKLKEEMKQEQKAYLDACIKQELEKIKRFKQCFDLKKKKLNWNGVTKDIMPATYEYLSQLGENEWKQGNSFYWNNSKHNRNPFTKADKAKSARDALLIDFSQRKFKIDRDLLKTIFEYSDGKHYFNKNNALKLCMT